MQQYKNDEPRLPTRFPTRLPAYAGLFCAALALAGCGGGDSAGQPDQFASDKVTKPATPLDKPARLDTAPFARLALASSCTERHNRMYVIDQTYVFWDSAGNCADASYSMRLFKRDTDTQVCAHGDSIAGPRTYCSDERERAFFDALVQNAEAGNLGLDASHTVEKVDLGVHQIAWSDIDARSYSGIIANRNVVIKDVDSWIKLWSEHAGSEPVPKIDFSSKMVIGLFNDMVPNGCYSTAVTAISLQADKLVVVRTDSFPGKPAPDAPPEKIFACTAAFAQPAHLVAVDRVDVPVEFVVKQREF